jgi:hypothetical protein
VLENREAIRELVYRYALCCDTGRFTDAIELFADDAVLDETAAGHPIAEGKQKIAAFLEYAQSFVNGKGDRALDYGVHLVTNQLLTELSDGQAKGVNNLLFEGRMRNGTRLRVLGYNQDEYVRTGEKWLFRYRRFVRLGEAEGFDQIT